MPPLPADEPRADDRSGWLVACLCAAWCRTCDDYREVMIEAARTHPGLRFAWVDIEDHAELADDFDVQTFPTLLVAGEEGTRFVGPLLPHAETLSRMLGALPPPQPSGAEVAALLAALERKPDTFRP